MLRVVLNAWVTKTPAAEILANPRPGGVKSVKARKLVIPIERKLLLFIRVGLPGHRERCTLTTP